MKKLVSLISALTMCAVMAAPMASSAATELNQTNSYPSNATINVEYTPTAAYIITIPDSVTVGHSIEVTASGVCLEDGKTVTISTAKEGNLTYESEYGGATDTIAYTIENGGEGIVLVKAGTATGTKSFAVELKEGEDIPKPLYANQYTGTTSFEVAVTDVPNASVE